MCTRIIGRLVVRAGVPVGGAGFRHSICILCFQPLWAAMRSGIPAFDKRLAVKWQTWSHIVGSPGNKPWSGISWILAVFSLRLELASFLAGNFGAARQCCKQQKHKVKRVRLASLLRCRNMQEQSGANVHSRTQHVMPKSMPGRKRPTGLSEIRQLRWQTAWSQSQDILALPLESWNVFLLCPNCRSQNWLCTKNRLH